MSDTNTAPSAFGALNAKQNMWLLFWVSVVTLFLELALIRWVSTEVRIFAYLQSSVLVVCLLGLGMGCFAADRKIDLRRLLAPLAVLALLMFIPATYQALGNLSTVLADFGNMHIWQGSLDDDIATWQRLGALFGALGLVTLILFMAWIAFIPLGQLVGGLVDGHDNTIVAYSVNIAGSFVGIALFTVASVLGLAPEVWFAGLAVGFIWLTLRLAGQHRALNIALAVLIPVLAWGGAVNHDKGDVVWSPYQKLELFSRAFPDSVTKTDYERYTINVNNAGYQSALDLRPESTARFPGLFEPEQAGLTQYDLPTMFKPQAGNVLIVGAGSGNDVAGALRGGAKSVTAVEIDPGIVAMGHSHHPEAPYANSAVTIVTDDARSFIARTEQSFDLIVFGLLDSHTTGAMTNARLDHYVYTAENIAQAKTLLKPGGVIFLAFEANKPYLIDRINRVLSQTFDAEPLKFRIDTSHYGYGGVMFVVGDQDAIQGALKSNTRLGDYVATLQRDDPLVTLDEAEVITDDWPYLYLEDRSIPALYGIMALILGLIYFTSGRLVGLSVPIKGWRMSEWHFFFLGAAFMLLEVHMIAKSVVALGSVWTVNAVIIGGIMGMILLANLIRAKVRNLPMGLVYVLLVGSSAGLYFVDLSAAAFLPYAQKVLIIAGVATLPMLFSGIVFIHSFNATPDKGRALGANLFGALVGGLLQSLTFVTGLQFLMLLVAALYLTAVLTARGAAAAALVEQPAE